MLILSENDVAHLLSPQQVILAVQEALMACENNGVTVPARMHLPFGQATLLCMPALSTDYFSTKLVSVFPGNAKKNLAIIQGALVLNDGQSGQPLALLNAAPVTALRTGALGAVAVKYLTPATETSVGLIGCGTQGQQLAAAVCAVRNINTLYFFDRSGQHTEALRMLLHRHYPAVSALSCSSAEAMLSKTNTIITATTSDLPVLPNDEKLLTGKHFIAMGAYKPTMQELPDAAFRLTESLVIDAEAARHETGDVINPLDRGWVQEADVFTLGKVLTGQRKVDVAKTTLFKSVGMAAFDLFVAKALYAAALKDDVGTRVPW